MIATATSATTVTLTFTPPSSNGGSEINTYNIYTNGIKTEQNGDDTTNTLYIINLTGNTNYTFQITAKNDIGESGPSNISEGIITYPVAPGNVRAAASMLVSSVATLDFSEQNNVSNLTQYDVKANNNDIDPADLSYTIGVTPFIITVNGLDAETTYTFKVQARNGEGPSGYSDASNQITTIAANTFRIDNIIYEIIFDPSGTDTGNVTIIGTYDVPESWNAVVPATVYDIHSNPYNVISVSDSAFNSLEKLINITFNSTTPFTFGASCFQGCTNLSAITFTSSTTPFTFGASCFEGCTKLSAITIPENTTSIGASCFENCDKITEITIPENTTSIGERCFANCGKLTTLNFPVGIQIIENEIARNCAKLEEVKMLGATEIQNGCFLECDKLTTVHAPKAETFGESCFKDCTSLTSVFFNKAKRFREGCFEGCTSLEEIIMHDNVTSLGTSCFEGCTSLIKMLWKNQLSLTSVGEDIFLNVPQSNNMVVTYEYTVDPDIDPDSLSAASKQLQDNDYPGTTNYIYLSKPSPCIVNDIIATGPTTVSIIFTSPSYTSNSPITSYTATSTPGNITSTLYVNKSINDDINTTMNMERAIQLTIYITGLTPNTTYTFVMHTFNAYGRSDPSNIFNPVTTDPEPTPNPNPVPDPSLTMFNIRRSRASYGQFWFGKSIGFPGFLYKKNNGVGGRRSTTMAPGGNSNCNTYQNVNNSYTPGSGVGGSSIAVRRAKRKYATIQTMNQYL